MLTSVPRLAPWHMPSAKALALSPLIQKKTALTTLPCGLIGSIVQLSRLVYNPVSKILQVPVLHSDRIGRMGAYTLDGGVLMQSVPKLNQSLRDTANQWNEGR